MDKAFKAPSKCLSFIPGPLIETSATKSRSHRSNWAVFKWTCDSDDIDYFQHNSSNWYYSPLHHAMVQHMQSLSQLNAMVWPRELPSIRLPTARRVLPSFESSSMHPKGTKQTELRPSLQRNGSHWNHRILHNVRIRNHLQSEIICGIHIYTLLYWWWWHPPRHVTVKHIAPSLAKMVRVQKTKNNEDPGGQKGSKIHIQSPSANQRMQGVNKEWTRKVWRMNNNDILSKLSKLSKLSRVAGPCDSWQSCRCDGTSNGGTSHRLQGERHPLQPLWTLFFTLSWKFPSVRSA